MNGPTPLASSRISAVAELRAWIVVGLVLSANMVGGAWWAATVSSELRMLRTTMDKIESQMSTSYSRSDAARDRASIQGQLNDHEARVRVLEGYRNGATAARRGP